MSQIAVNILSGFVYIYQLFQLTEQQKWTKECSDYSLELRNVLHLAEADYNRSRSRRSCVSIGSRNIMKEIFFGAMNKVCRIIDKANIRRFWTSLLIVDNNSPLYGGTVDWRRAHVFVRFCCRTCMRQTNSPWVNPLERAYSTSTNALLRHCTGNVSRHEEGRLI